MPGLSITAAVRRTADWGRVALLVGAAPLALAPVLAHAEAADAPAPAATTGTEIVVTAQKRSESIQRVPISLQALGAATLEQHQVQGFDDYAKQLPSVSFQSYGPGNSQLSFRGITSGGIDLPFGSLPTSGVYVDEIPVTTIGALLDIHVYDMARIEALSGPQGTLYGASSLSGTLRLITNKPEQGKTYGSLDATIDQYGKGNAGGTLEGFINLPLTPKVALRLVGWIDHTGGYINSTPKTRTYQRWHPDASGTLVASPFDVSNAAYVKDHYNDVDTYGGRAALGIDLDDNWTVTPQLLGQYQKSHGSFLYDPRAGDLTVHAFTPEYNRDEWLQAALTIQGKIGNWDLTYSGGYLTRDIDQALDYSYYTVAYDILAQTAGDGNTSFFQTAAGKDIDPTQRFLGHQKLSKLTSELRFNSPAGNALKLTAGLFFQRQQNHLFLQYQIPGLGQNVVTSWWDTQVVYGDDPFITNAYVKDRDYAAFAQGTWDLGSGVTLTGGIRGFISDNTLSGYSGFASAAPSTCTLPLATPDACTNLIGKRAYATGETHKLSLSWQIDPDHMLYSTYSTGFRPGGNNRFGAVAPYRPDTLDNFELGWKTSWFDHKLRFNGAVYYEKWKNLQYALVIEGSGGITNIYNAGNARVYGIETDLQLRPVAGLTLSVASAYNDAALSTPFCAIAANGNPDCSSGNVAAPVGTRLPVQPRFKTTATARYEWSLGTIDAFVQGSFASQSNTTSVLSVANDQLLGDSAGFTTFDFSVGGKKGETSLQLFIQNAFDNRGSLSHISFVAPQPSVPFSRIYPTKPQFFGLKLGRKF